MVWRDPGIYFQVIDEDPGELTLETIEGTPIPASIRSIGNDMVFAPDEPVAPETQLRLSYEYDCGNETPGEVRTYEFTTSEHGQIEPRAAGVSLQANTFRPAQPDCLYLARACCYLDAGAEIPHEDD